MASRKAAAAAHTAGQWPVHSEPVPGVVMIRSEGYAIALGLDPEQAGQARRVADRSASVGAERDAAHSRGSGHCRSPR